MDAAVDHAAHLDRLLPVPAVARKARDFAGAHGSDLAQADFGDHPFEAGTLRPAGCRATEIVVDHLDLRPAQRHQAIAHGILKRAALPVVQDLMSRRLTRMEQRHALQMMGKNLFRDHGRPPRPRCAVSGRCAPGSIVSSDRLARFLPRPEGPTRSVRRRSSVAESRRTGRTAAALVAECSCSALPHAG